MLLSTLTMAMSNRDPVPKHFERIASEGDTQESERVRKAIIDKSLALTISPSPSYRPVLEA